MFNCDCCVNVQVQVYAILIFQALSEFVAGKKTSNKTINAYYTLFETMYCNKIATKLWGVFFLHLYGKLRSCKDSKLLAH